MGSTALLAAAAAEKSVEVRFPLVPLTQKQYNTCYRMLLSKVPHVFVFISHVVCKRIGGSSQREREKNISLLLVFLRGRYSFG